MLRERFHPGQFSRYFVRGGNVSSERLVATRAHISEGDDSSGSFKMVLTCSRSREMSLFSLYRYLREINGETLKLVAPAVCRYLSLMQVIRGPSQRRSRPSLDVFHGPASAGSCSAQQRWVSTSAQCWRPVPLEAYAFRGKLGQTHNPTSQGAVETCCSISVW